MPTPSKRSPSKRTLTKRTLTKRSFALSGHRTSVALEPEFWDALERLARRDLRSLTALVAGVDAGRDPARPLASALRVHVLGRLTGGSNEEPNGSLKNKT